MIPFCQVYCKEVLEDEGGMLAINPKHTKLVTALRTAVENGEGALDKEATSQSGSQPNSQSVSQILSKPLKCRKMTTKDTLIAIVTNGISQFFLSHLNINECVTLEIVTN